MRVLIFSDTHLYHSFDKKKYVFLRNIITKADRVVINGDFWDGYLTTFDRFVESKWKDLFPLLKKKQAIYLYGNHDKKTWSDERVKLFSVDQRESVVLDFGNYRLLIEHGDKIVHKIDALLPWLPRHAIFGYLSDYFQRLGMLSMGEAFFAFWDSKNNEKMMKHAQNISKQNEILVCGHTHLAQLAINKHFANSGIIRFGCGQYLLVENEEIKLIKDHY
ncbi:MAG: metallophosphoesterase family protein [Candidatus Roizmanbacteria bacterium]|nr:metallophosphoesterase family protein [Candidatus Roizmanbacteria bacterium]